MKRNMIVASTLLAIGLPAAAQETAPLPPIHYSALFRKLDTDRDYLVTRAEAKRVRGFENTFGVADENSDGKLSRDEFVKAQSLHERNQSKTYMSDSMITAKVKAALITDLPATPVSVETHAGRVLLSGFVDDAQDVKQAKEIAAAVKGVSSVTTALLIK